MIQSLRASLLMLVFLASAGCASHRVIVVNNIEVYENIWNQTMRDLAPRASFDLHCQVEQMQFILFRRTGRYPVEVGVMGCGAQAVYSRPSIGGYISNNWVLQSSTVQSGPSQLSGVAPPPVQ